MNAEPDDFRPPLWLRNRHLQTMMASSGWRRPRVLRRAKPLLDHQREVLLDCGAGVRLQCFISGPPQPLQGLVVLVHGWEGHADSVYMLSLAQQLFERGWRVARLNLRDHGETHHLNRGLFHSCRLAEVVGAVHALQQQHRGLPVQLAGFSLGGNFMLRVAAQARPAGLDLTHVLAISPVLEPAQTLRALQSGPPGYQRYFVRKWLRSLHKKQRAWPDTYDFREIGRLRNLESMTAELVRRYTSFASLKEYLDGYAITGDYLAQLTVPATLITALDDPIIPAAALARLARSPQLSLLVTQRGGHCGFFEGLTEPTWLERRTIALLTAHAQAAGNGFAPLPAETQWMSA